MGAIILLAEVPMFFIMPETKFTGLRPSIMPPARYHGLDKHEIHVEKVERAEGFEESSAVVSGGLNQERPFHKDSYLRSLALWSKGDPEVNLLRAFLRPFVLLGYPTVLWSCCIYGLSLSWNVVIGTSLAQLYAPPPYNFDSQSLGLCWLGPLIGSLVGTYLCGPLADRVANFYTKRNYGIREPEMRLPTCAIAALITFLGALMLSLGLYYQTHRAVAIVGLGILSAGAQMGATLAMSYSVGIHKEVSRYS